MQRTQSGKDTRYVRLSAEKVSRTCGARPTVPDCKRNDTVAPYLTLRPCGKACSAAICYKGRVMQNACLRRETGLCFLTNVRFVSLILRLSLIPQKIHTIHSVNLHDVLTFYGSYACSQLQGITRFGAFNVLCSGWFVSSAHMFLVFVHILSLNSGSVKSF